MCLYDRAFVRECVCACICLQCASREACSSNAIVVVVGAAAVALCLQRIIFVQRAHESVQSRINCENVDNVFGSAVFFLFVQRSRQLRSFSLTVVCSRDRRSIFRAYPKYEYPHSPIAASSIYDSSLTDACVDSMCAIRGGVRISRAQLCYVCGSRVV